MTALDFRRLLNDASGEILPLLSEPKLPLPRAGDWTLPKIVA